MAMEKARAALPPLQCVTSDVEINTIGGSGSVKRTLSNSYPLYDVHREEEPHLCNSDGRLEKNISELDAECKLPPRVT